MATQRIRINEGCGRRTPQDGSDIINKVKFSIIITVTVVRQNECVMMDYSHDISMNKIKRVKNISHWGLL